ncbi:Zn-ribbon domain-containing OB-fold protein [Rhodococcus opacus]|uniref:Zn-ribbon domain-containing OB-fold protein n=1 Tax=Rhodococcus opacus TaxID=37919 RepID=UPI0024744B8D|nr:OB-fold domain-containing protein [Rhodococcus opacus]MDH6293397.1 putative OB-fold protein [Rhodococcus opacus]
MAQDYAAPYFEGIEQGELRAQRCTACGNAQLHPRRRCAECGSKELTYFTTNGQGTLYTFATIYRSAPSAFIDQVPYTLGVVTLEDDVRMLTRIVGAEDADLHCDMPVHLTMSSFGEGPTLPCFTPATLASDGGSLDE